MFCYYLSAHGLPIAVQARLSGKSRSSFYYKRKQPTKDAALLEEIREVHERHPFYGYKRIAQELAVSHKRTYRLMRHHNIRARSSRKRHSKNQYSSNKTSLPNFLKDLTITEPNQVWAGDFTHFAWHRRTFYLATVIDQYTRQAVGWHVASNHSTELVMEALRMALGRRSKAPKIFHSDHGSEYIGEEFVANLKANGITPSNSAFMARKDDEDWRKLCLQRSAIESVFDYLKEEHLSCLSFPRSVWISCSLRDGPWLSIDENMGI